MPTHGPADRPSAASRLTRRGRPARETEHARAGESRAPAADRSTAGDCRRRVAIVRRRYSRTSPSSLKRSRDTRRRESGSDRADRGSRTLEVGRSRNCGERAAHRLAVVAFGPAGLAECGGFELAVVPWGWSSPVGSSLLVLGWESKGERSGRLAGSHTRVAWGEFPPFSSLLTRAVVRPRTRGTARSQRTRSARRYRRCCWRPALRSAQPGSCTSPTRGPRGGRRCRPHER